MIIDFHTHVFPDKIAAATIGALSRACNIPSYSDGTVAGLLARMREAGVNIGINLPAITKPSQLDGVLRYATELNSKSAGDCRIISFAGIHPDGEDAELAMDRIARAGILGVKIHPDYQGTFIDDDKYVRLVSAAKRQGLIVVTHAGVDGAYLDSPVRCTPFRIMRLLDRIGGYDRLVLAHLGGNELGDEVLEELAGKADVYLDTAYVLGRMPSSTAYKIIERQGVDRILFGTDSPWRDISDVKARLGELSFDSAELDKILGVNAAKLLRIGVNND